MLDDDGSHQDSGGLGLGYLLPVGVVMVVVILLLMLISSLGGSDSSSAQTAVKHRDLPAYWTVKAGDTYASIAQKTGLSVDQLETFNPYTNPDTIAPGELIQLRLHVPAPARKAPGPRFWTVRRGQTYDSIAGKTGHSIEALQLLNPRLNANALQPGDRVRLRR